MGASFSSMSLQRSACVLWAEPRALEEEKRGHLSWEMNLPHKNNKDVRDAVILTTCKNASTLLAIKFPAPH